MAYIYQIVNDINNKIYVGKTEFSIEKRFQEHCNDAYRERCEKRPLYAAIRKYGVEHFHISLIEDTDNPEERECYWIEQLGSFKNGYNATKGGDGRKYLDYDLIIATYNQVHNCAEVARILNISVDSVRKILHNYKIPIIDSTEVNKLHSQKMIGMYDKEDNLIHTFSSLTDGAKFIQNNNLTTSKSLYGITSHITHVCKGLRKTAYGYIWKYIQ